MKVLIVEDDATIATSLGDLLRAEGFDVAFAARQDDAIEQIRTSTYDLILLDITLAQGSGFAVCAAVKETHPCLPVIFLTASDDEFSTVAGLDMGAADYIAKPFRPRELLSRIRAALRKTESSLNQPVLTFAELQLDSSSGTLAKNGKEIPLSALEYRILLYFFQNQNRLITRENLRDAIWDSAGEYISDNALNVYICRLRDKIEENPSKPAVITTIRGLGYRIGTQNE